MKLTGWYDGKQKPVRVGVYERKYGNRVFFCWWGVEWGMGTNNQKCAESLWWIAAAPNQCLPWRGVAK